MLALDAASRTLLATAAFAAFGAAFVTTPLIARTEAAVPAAPAPSVAPLPMRTAFTDVAPRRDPFAGGDPPTRANASPGQPPLTSTAASSFSQNPAIPQIPAALRALPPNAGAGDDVFSVAATARTSAVVTAVITGPHPFALVDEAGTTRVLTVGDRIDGDAIVAVGIDGVRLAHGTRLPVTPASQPASPVPPPAPAPAPAQPSARVVAPPPGSVSPRPTTTSHPISGGRST